MASFYRKHHMDGGATLHLWMVKTDLVNNLYQVITQSCCAEMQLVWGLYESNCQHTDQNAAHF